MSNTRPTLLVFVHGFLGSGESFRNFPQDLLELLSNDINEYKVLLYPRYDTKGDNRLAVKNLIDWLLINATTAFFSRVIILAHSMGGILAVDAYRQMYGVKAKVKTTSAEEKPNMMGFLISSLATTVFKSQNSQSSIGNSAQSETITRTSINTMLTPKTSTAAEPTTIVPRALLNVVGILTFDSPFYGLNPLVSLTGVAKAGLLAKQAATTSTVAVAGTAAAMTYAFSNYFPIGMLGSTASTITSAVATWVAEETRSHLEFLYPLSESKLDMEERVDAIVQDNSLAFKACYLQAVLSSDMEIIQSLDSQPMVASSAAVKNGNVGISSSQPGQISPKSKHFCVFPPENHSHICWTVSSFHSDEIDAHMNIFDSSNGEEYKKLLQTTYSNILDSFYLTSNLDSTFSHIY